jgi:hypothetical protein
MARRAIERACRELDFGGDEIRLRRVLPPLSERLLRLVPSHDSDDASA